MPLSILFFINLLATGLFAGALFGTWFGVSPTMLSLPASTYIQIQQSMIRSFDPGMPILASLSLLSGSVLLWQLKHRLRSRLFLFCALSSAFFIIGLAFTFIVNVPINMDVVTWSSASPPETWNDSRQSWETANTYRTWAAVLSFALDLIAISNFTIGNSDNVSLEEKK
jgi:uncharacterized membrane protein